MNKTLILLLLAAACGSKKSGGASGGFTKADADTVNAMIPADLKGKIEFEVRTFDDGSKRHPETYTLVAPKGWKKAFLPGGLEPEDSDKFESKTWGKTSIRVGTNCDGTCEKKDWAKVVDKVYYSQFTDGNMREKGKIIKDEKGANGRTMIWQGENAMGKQQITLITTWWTADSSKHYFCEVELGEPAIGLANAFEKACAKVGFENDD